MSLLAGAAAIAIPVAVWGIRAFHKWLTSPVFNVNIDLPDVDRVVIAGQKTEICTISIRLRDDYKPTNPEEQLDIPIPLFTLRKGNSVASQIVPEAVVTCREMSRDTRGVTVALIACVTSVGVFTTKPEFSKGVYTDGVRHVQFQVRPAEPTSLTLRSRKPGHGDGKGDSVYRGGTVKISVEAKDKFGNKSDESDLNITVSNVYPNSSFVTQILPPVYLTKEGCYVIPVRCVKAGTASFDLSFPNVRQVLKINNLEIIPPPISASKSHILQDDCDRIQRREHKPGQIMRFQLELYDIYGKYLPTRESSAKIPGKIRLNLLLDCPDCDNSRHGLCQVHRHLNQKKKLKDEEKSLAVHLPDGDSNCCVLSFTPLMAGNRSLTVSIAENESTNVVEVKNSPLQITVVPGPLVVIATVEHKPSSSKNITSYPTENRVVRVEGLDEFGNKVLLGPTKWHLVTDAGDILQGKDVILDQEARTLAFYYSFAKKGKYKVTMEPVNAATECHIKVPSFEVDVTSVPLDPRKCQVCVCQEPPVFTGTGKPLKILVTLLDCTNKRYEYWKLNSNSLKVQVNGRVSQVALKLRTEIGQVCVTILDIEEGGRKEVQVMYDGRLLGHQIHVNIVGLHSYHEENNIQFSQDSLTINCWGVPRSFLIGPEYANVDNINRTLEDEDGKLSGTDITVMYTARLHLQNEECVHFDLRGFTLEDAQKVFRLISLLVKGRHYRRQASEFDKQREEWKGKATEAYGREEYIQSEKCKAIKEKYGELMNESHNRASVAIFNFYNEGRSESEIDLHGQLVADPRKLRDYEKQLLSKRDKTPGEVKVIIEKERKKRDEAIRYLDQRLTGFNHETARWCGRYWLEVIDGAGHHSYNERQKIRPKVIGYLERIGRRYIESNEGALLVTFSEYSGEEPCLANFYCKKCKKTWTSGSSWNGMFQRCFRCDRKGVACECYPFKLRPLSASTSRRGRSRRASDFTFTNKDHRRLCQKCITSGRDCRSLTTRRYRH